MSVLVGVRSGQVSTEVTKPIAFTWFEEHYGAIEESFGLFAGHFVVVTCEELFCSVY